MMNTLASFGTSLPVSTLNWGPDNFVLVFSQIGVVTVTVISNSPTIIDSKLGYNHPLV